MRKIGKIATRLLLPVCAVLLAAPAYAGPYGLKFTFSGTFNAGQSFLGGDTTDWSKVNGVLSFVNDPSAQNPNAGEFLGVASLDLIILDSKNSQLGSISQTGLNLKFVDNVNCSSYPAGCSAGNYDQMSVGTTLTSPIGGLAAGRKISAILAGNPIVFVSPTTLDEVMGTIAQTFNTPADWNFLFNAQGTASQVVTNIAIPVVIHDLTVNSVTTFDAPSSVPEPSTLGMTLSAAALLGLWGRGRLRRRS